MWKNYFKIAFRHLAKRWKFSLINLSGLAVGLAACVLIALYIHHEWAFDQFHELEQDLYRITTHESDDGVYKHTAYSYHPLKSRLDESLPIGSKTVRYLPQSISIKNLLTNEVQQEPSFVFADSLFFDVFSFEFVAGDPSTPLNNRSNLVITESTAKRLFSNTDPIGQVLELEGKTDATIVAVIKDPPINSSLQFDMVAPLSLVPTALRQNFFHPNGAWYYPPIYTFAYIPDQRYVAEWPSYQERWKEEQLPTSIRDRYVFDMQPMAQLHFESLEADFAPSINSVFLWILLIVAIMVLAMACINYINLSIGQLLRRFSEIGIRKVLGAGNANLLHQMITEAFSFLLIALLMAGVLVHLSLPAFNNLTGYDFTFVNIFSHGLWLYLTLTILLLSCLIAAFPYYALKKKQIIQALKNERTGNFKRRFSLKDTLVVLQFSVAIALVAATLVIQSQTSFIMEKDLGFSPEQVLVIPIRDQKLQKEYLVMKEKLLAQNGVRNVSAISNFPWQGGFYDFPSKFIGGGIQKDLNLPTFVVDPDFIKAMDIDLIEGRNFHDRVGRDAEAAFIINEAAKTQLGIENISDYRINMDGIASGPAREGNIIATTEDFYLKSLHNPIDPLVLTVAPESYYLDNFILQVETEQISSTLAGISHTWNEVMPDRPLEYFFLDETFENLYRKESRMYGIFKTFSLLAIFIAFLGLYALAALAANRRLKEIGVRKILGATSFNIVGILSKDFIKLVSAAFLIATPIAWFFMDRWLSGFAHHIDMTLWTFVLAGALAICITLFVVGWQAFRAAVINPIHSLRTE